MQPSETNVESMDQKFLKKVLNCIETHIEDDTFTVDQLGDDSRHECKPSQPKTQVPAGSDGRSFYPVHQVEKGS